MSYITVLKDLNMDNQQQEDESIKNQESSENAKSEIFQDPSFLILIIISILYIQMFKDRKFFLAFEYLIGAFGAAIFFVPSFYFENAADVDETLLYFTRVLGLMKCGVAFTVYLMENSSDKTARVSMSISQILSRISLSLMLVNRITVHREDKTNIFGIKLALLIMLMLMVYDIVNLPKLSRRSGSLKTSEQLGTHLALDGFISLIYALLLFAFPDMVLKSVFPETSVTLHHKLVMQGIGGYQLSLAFLIFFALTFSIKNDIAQVVRAKCMVSAVAVLLSMFWAYSHGTMTIGHMILLPGINLLLVANGFVLDKILSGWSYFY